MGNSELQNLFLQQPPGNARLTASPPTQCPHRQPHCIRTPLKKLPQQPTPTPTARILLLPHPSPPPGASPLILNTGSSRLPEKKTFPDHPVAPYQPPSTHPWTQHSLSGPLPPNRRKCQIISPPVSIPPPEQAVLSRLPHTTSKVHTMAPRPIPHPPNTEIP